VLATCIALLRALTCTDSVEEAEALAAQGAVDWGCHALQIVQGADGTASYNQTKESIRGLVLRRAAEEGLGATAGEALAEGVLLGLTPTQILDGSQLQDAALVATNLLRFPQLQVAGCAGGRISATTVLQAAAHSLRLAGRHVQPAEGVEAGSGTDLCLD